MKKIFTLISMALMAVGANAQEKFLVGADTDLASYQGVDYKATASVKLFCGENASGWNAVSPLKGDEDHAFDEFTHYTSGKDNPVSGEKTKYSLSNHTVPDKGAYYILKPSAAGSLQVGIILNGGKDFYVVDGEGVALSDFDLKDEEGKVVALSADCKTSDKFYGILTFNVEAGKSYYVFCNGSKLGFAGFKFNTTAATIDSKTTAAAKEAIDAAIPSETPGNEEVVATPTADKATVTGKSYTAGENQELTKDASGDYLKMRTGNNGNTITLTVNSGYNITGVKLEGYSNNKSTTADRSILVNGIYVDGAETSVLASPVTLPGGTAGQTPATAEASGFEAKEKVVFSFDNSNIVSKEEDSDGKNKQIYAKITVTFKEGTGTGIQDIKSQTIDLNAPAYNLAGQKVDKSYKGVVIQNGKKMIQK